MGVSTSARLRISVCECGGVKADGVVRGVIKAVSSADKRRAGKNSRSDWVKCYLHQMVHSPLSPSSPDMLNSMLTHEASSPDALDAEVPVFYTQTETHSIHFSIARPCVHCGTICIHKNWGRRATRARVRVGRVCDSKRTLSTHCE